MFHAGHCLGASFESERIEVHDPAGKLRRLILPHQAKVFQHLLGRFVPVLAALGHGDVDDFTNAG
jgi:hypothetical protein